MRSQSHCLPLSKEPSLLYLFQNPEEVDRVRQQHSTVCGGGFAACWLGSPYKVRTYSSCFLMFSGPSVWAHLSTSQSTALTEDQLQKQLR